MTDRTFEFWTPEPIWRGETAFVLGSGPSMTADIIAKVKGRRTIAVNSTALHAPDAEILFFTDSSWYEKHRDFVAAWRGLVISLSPTAKRELPDKVRRVKSDGDWDLPFDRFPKPGSAFIQQGRSSGHTAISLEIALGAAKVVMLGFDMRVVDGREHHHSDYTGERGTAVYAECFVPGFKGWNAAAIASGVEILNATPGSAVTEFPFVDLDEVLSCARS